MRGAIGRFWRDYSGSAIAKHCAALAALLLLLCGLLTQLVIDWHTSDTRAIQTTGALESLRKSNLPIRGAADRLATTKNAINDFYDKRIPASYSQISSRIIAVGIASGVQLSHVTYDQRAHGAFLTEISIESQVNGTYPQIMHFVNGLERDQACFVIRAMTLTGQQGGDVSLQLRFSTWIRPTTHELAGTSTAKLEQRAAGSPKEID